MSINGVISMDNRPKDPSEEYPLFPWYFVPNCCNYKKFSHIKSFYKESTKHVANKKSPGGFFNKITSNVKSLNFDDFCPFMIRQMRVFVTCILPKMSLWAKNEK